MINFKLGLNMLKNKVSMGKNIRLTTKYNSRLIFTNQEGLVMKNILNIIGCAMLNPHLMSDTYIAHKMGIHNIQLPDSWKTNNKIGLE